MMNEKLQFIKDTFLNYYADQKYFILYLIALLFIFIKERRKINQNLLLYYPLIVFILVLNPMFVSLLLKIIPSSVYCRFFWLVPFGIAIAYLGVELITKIENNFKKRIAIVVFILILLYSGKFMYMNSNFTKVTQVNILYKMPEEYIQVAKKIKEIPFENKKAMVSTDLVGYIRQFDASIKLAYQRLPQLNYERYPIVNTYNAGDVKNLVSQCKQNDINIIVYDNSIPLTISPSHYGYDLYAQTEHYDIYALIKKD